MKQHEDSRPPVKLLLASVWDISQVMTSIFSAVINGVAGFVNPVGQDINGVAGVSTNSAVSFQESASIEQSKEVVDMDVDMDVEMQAAVVEEINVTAIAGPSGTSNLKTYISRASSLPPVLQPDDRKLGYVYDIQMLLHRHATGHPEDPERIRRIFEELSSTGCLKQMRRIPIRKVKKSEALLVHSEDHWDKVELIQRMTEQDIIDSESYYEHLSLYICPTTTYAAKLSCGGVIDATLAVAKGELLKTFAIVRPPGHHAEPEEHMGFCFFNNVAVAVRVTQQLTQIKRILILDWDVHHGNGTQRAFIDDPGVLYISLHRYEGGLFYPCGPFGSLGSCGEGAGLGMSVNIPWPEKGMGDADYLLAFQKIVMPIAMEYSPELVIISAGFDAAEGDDLGECRVTPAGYAHMTHMLSSLAGGRLVVALEGGYNIESITRSSLAVARVMIGEAPPELPSMVASDVGTETVWQVALQQSKYWKSINPKACEPSEEYEDLAISIPEILKAHRQNYLYEQFNMLQIPLLDEEIEQRFNSQVICTEDIMDQDVIVIFVHEFGNIRVELDGAMTCNLHLEHSYLIDVTKKLMEWVRGQKYALVEVNTYPRPPLQISNRSSGELGREVVTYVWDNYVQLSRAKNIILIGHGPGCHALIELISARVHNVMAKVKAIVQVVGNSDLPLLPRDNNELRLWYINHSFVAVPQNHRIFYEGKVLKRHGHVVPYNELKAVKLLSRALPEIQIFIHKSLSANAATQVTGQSGQ